MAVRDPGATLPESKAPDLPRIPSGPTFSSPPARSRRTMLRKSLAPLALCVAVRAIAAQEQQAPLRVAASSFATVEVHINARPIGDRWYEEDASLTGPARIAISYGQPHARGRKVE